MNALEKNKLWIRSKHTEEYSSSHSKNSGKIGAAYTIYHLKSHKQWSCGPENQNKTAKNTYKISMDRMLILWDRPYNHLYLD